MLADRGDIQLAAIATDPGLLGSSEAVSRHRSRQRERAREMRPRTAEGRRRRDAPLHLLNDEALHDDEYLLAACLPLVLSDIAQRAFAFFAHDEHRTDMEGFVVRIDEEAAPTMRYSDASLLPTLGGDSRFSFRFPTSWRDGAVHPLLARILHPDGDGVMPQELFNDVDWASSEDTRNPNCRCRSLGARASDEQAGRNRHGGVLPASPTAACRGRWPDCSVIQHPAAPRGSASHVPASRGGSSATLVAHARLCGSQPTQLVIRSRSLGKRLATRCRRTSQCRGYGSARGGFGGPLRQPEPQPPRLPHVPLNHHHDRFYRSIAVWCAIAMATQDSCAGVRPRAAAGSHPVADHCRLM